MFLFILESIGTSELLLIAIVALIFLGPRKMPGMARKIGKMMAEFRATTNEFKSTWEREVDFSSELDAMRLDDLDEKPVKRVVASDNEITARIAEPAIKEVENIDLDPTAQLSATETTPKEPVDDVNDRKNWL